MNGKRNTAKEKAKRNKGFPYHRTRCSKCGQILTKCECDMEKIK